jgi:hypothetical protein
MGVPQEDQSSYHPPPSFPPGRNFDKKVFTQCEEDENMKEEGMMRRYFPLYDRCTALYHKSLDMVIKCRPILQSPPFPSFFSLIPRLYLASSSQKVPVDRQSVYQNDVISVELTLDSSLYAMGSNIGFGFRKLPNSVTKLRRKYELFNTY